MVFTVEELTDTEARCRVVVGGTLSNNKSMSFPNKVMSQVYLSEQDKADLLLGVENGVDYVACSFVSCKQDILDVKEFLAQHTSEPIGIIAKIENQAGIDNLEEICKVCDGIMVAVAIWVWRYPSRSCLPSRRSSSIPAAAWASAPSPPRRCWSP